MLSAKVPDAGGTRFHSVTSGGAFLQKAIGSCGDMAGSMHFLVPEKRLMVVITSLTQVDDDVNVSVEYIIGIVRQDCADSVIGIPKLA